MATDWVRVGELVAGFREAELKLTITVQKDLYVIQASRPGEWSSFHWLWGLVLTCDPDLVRGLEEAAKDCGILKS
jgi:hypothetical protein